MVLFSVIQKQMAFMLGRHGMFLELNEDVEDYEDLTEIMSNVQLNSNFLALAREVGDNRIQSNTFNRKWWYLDLLDFKMNRTDYKNIYTEGVYLSQLKNWTQEV